MRNKQPRLTKDEIDEIIENIDVVFPCPNKELREAENCHHAEICGLTTFRAILEVYAETGKDVRKYMVPYCPLRDKGFDKDRIKEVAMNFAKMKEGQKKLLRREKRIAQSFPKEAG